MNIPNRIRWLQSEIDRLKKRLSPDNDLSFAKIEKIEDMIYDYECELEDLERNSQ